MKFVSLFVILFNLLSIKLNAQDVQHFEVDSLRAIQIAKESWAKVYGKKSATKFKPYYAELKNDSVWVVRGTLPRKKGRIPMGGTPYAEVQKNGQILFIKHGK